LRRHAITAATCLHPVSKAVISCGLPLDRAANGA